MCIPVAHNRLFISFKVVVFLSMIQHCMPTQAEIKEYCTLETFSASCEESEVVTMQSALYGLMKPGRCVAEEVSHIECQSDQLSYLDKLCSGRQSCELSISNNREMQDNTPCPPGAAAYLEASYTCKKTLSIDRNTCTRPVIVGNGVTTFSSMSCKDSGCGTANRPLTIEAKTGQKINVTLEDFSRDSTGFNIQKLNCHRLYGHLVSYDSSDIIDICGTTARKTNVYMSNSHKMQIALDENALEKYVFLISVEVSGCPNFAPPAKSWIRKDAKRMVVGCVSGSETWEMKCVGNHWIGNLGNCTRAAESQEGSTAITIPEEFNGSHVLSIAIGCLAFVLCCITITVGVYFIKRYKTKMALQSTYGKLNKSPGAPQPVFTDLRSVPTDNPSRSSTIFVRSRDLNHSQVPGYTLSRGVPNTLASQHRRGLSDTSTIASQPVISRIEQTSNREYENLPADRESTLYYVLEKPPGYTDNN